MGSTVLSLVDEEIGVEHNKEYIPMNQAVPKLLTVWFCQMLVSRKP